MSYNIFGRYTLGESDPAQTVSSRVAADAAAHPGEPLALLWWSTRIDGTTDHLTDAAKVQSIASALLAAGPQQAILSTDHQNLTALAAVPNVNKLHMVELHMSPEKFGAILPTLQSSEYQAAYAAMPVFLSIQGVQVADVPTICEQLAGLLKIGVLKVDAGPAPETSDPAVSEAVLNWLVGYLQRPDAIVGYKSFYPSMTAIYERIKAAQQPLPLGAMRAAASDPVAAFVGSLSPDWITQNQLNQFKAKEAKAAPARPMATPAPAPQQGCGCRRAKR